MALHIRRYSKKRSPYQGILAEFGCEWEQNEFLTAE